MRERLLFVAGTAAGFVIGMGVFHIMHNKQQSEPKIATTVVNVVPGYSANPVVYDDPLHNIPVTPYEDPNQTPDQADGLR